MATNKKAKFKYWQKVYDEAPLVECACGCGELIKSKDKYGRDKKYISGHNGRKYQDKNQYKKEWLKDNPDWKRKWKKQYRSNRKISLIEYKGSKCSSCGLEYNGKNAVVFDFHHVDPTQKSFSLSSSYLVNRSLDLIYKEADKCILLCANCHRLEHHSHEDG